MNKRAPNLNITDTLDGNFHRFEGKFKYKSEEYHTTITYTVDDPNNAKDAKKELSLWMKSLITDIDNDSK